MTTRSRKVRFLASHRRYADEWAKELNEFYEHSPRRWASPDKKNTVSKDHVLFGATFPPRSLSCVKAYTCNRDYFCDLAVTLLSARTDIFIATWKLNPNILLTRPPMPPVRLDQILKFKAEHGDKIYVLLYKESSSSLAISNKSSGTLVVDYIHAYFY